MGVRQKFFALSGVAGVIMAIVSIVGYFTASEAVENTTEKEIVAVITAAADEAEGWMLEKAQYGEATARMLSSYRDSSTNKLCITVAVPYARQGAKGGVICEDISMTAIEEMVKQIKYEGEGKGMILNPASGIIIASADEAEALKKIEDNAVLKDHIAEMVQKKEGYFLSSAGGSENISITRWTRRWNGLWHWLSL